MIFEVFKEVHDLIDKKIINNLEYFIGYWIFELEIKFS